MEKLPPEILEIIAEQLSPQDLARCSAVCRDWREIFNVDCIWNRHCDAEVEEPLRTIPCAATPAFVSPEGENSTLPPICQKRLAFMRENHLQKNWKRKEIMDDNKNDLVFFNQDLVDVAFLTDTNIVVWYTNNIEIFDVSGNKAVLLAKTDVPIKIKHHHRCSVVKPTGTLILVETENNVQVYYFDMTKKVINLKHCIDFNRFTHNPNVSRPNDSLGLNVGSHSFVKENYFLFIDDHKLNLKIFDLNTGEILKEEPYPSWGCQNESTGFWQMQSSSTSDFVAVSFTVSAEGMLYNYFFFNIRQLSFLPDTVINFKAPDCFQVALHQHWLAYIDCMILIVHDFRTRQVELTEGGDYAHEIRVFVDSFIFIDNNKREPGLRSYFPSDYTLTTIFEGSCHDINQVKANKVFIESDEGMLCLLKLKDHSIKKIDMSDFDGDFNRSCTKLLNKDLEDHGFVVKHVW